MGRCQLFALAAACVFSGPTRAQEMKEVSPEDPIHQQLRDIRDKMVEAFNKRDVEGLIQYLHPDVVVTWQNGEVSRKHEGLRQYYQKMLLGPNAIVDTVSIDKVDVAEPSILYGKDKGTAVAWGTMDDRYRLRDGMQFNLHSHWTVTLFNAGDRWLVAEAHLSGNIFENEVLYTAVKRTALLTLALALAAGLALGVVGAWLVRRRGGAPA